MGALLALAIGVGACVVAFGRGMRDAPGGAGSGNLHLFARITNPHTLALALALALVAPALVGFFFGPMVGVPLWAAALGGGGVVLVLAPAARVPPRAVARKVDVGILVFFVGLFVLLETVRASGFLDLLAAPIARGGSGAFVVVTAVLSNVVSNVPAVLLLLPTVTADGQAILLAAASTLAGNATFLGSLRR